MVVVAVVADEEELAVAVAEEVAAEEVEVVVEALVVEEVVAGALLEEVEAGDALAALDFHVEVAVEEEGGVEGFRAVSTALLKQTSFDRRKWYYKLFNPLYTVNTHQMSKFFLIIPFFTHLAW